MSISLNEYQEGALETAVYPGRGALFGLNYTALGLNGEAGEFADKVKKILRDGKPEDVRASLFDTVVRARLIGLVRRDALILELGDVLWYVATAAAELNVSLEEVAFRNLRKLEGRKARGVLGGSGDDR